MTESKIRADETHETDKYKTDLSFNYKESNLFMLLLFASIVIMCTCIYFLIWGFDDLWNDLKEIVFNALITVPLLIGGFILHEGLHAVTLLLFAGIPFSHLKAGVNLINLTPYIHCRYPVKVNHYVISTAAPAILMGIIPIIIAIASGMGGLLFFGVIFLVSSGSDLLCLWKLRKTPGNYLASDHPEKAGCIVYEDPFQRINQ